MSTDFRLLNALNAAFAGLPDCGRNPPGILNDPGDSPACDWFNDACGMIAYAAQSETADMKDVLCDDEVTHEVQGNTVLFTMPRMTIRVPAVNGVGEPIRDADLLTRWVLDEWYLAVSAALRGAK